MACGNQKNFAWNYVFWEFERQNILQTYVIVIYTNWLMEVKRISEITDSNIMHQNLKVQSVEWESATSNWDDTLMPEAPFDWNR